MQGRPRLAARLTTMVPGVTGPGPAIVPGRGAAVKRARHLVYRVSHAVHRAIVVVDIVDSTDPIRRNGDRVVIRDAMYDSLSGAFKRLDWLRCYHEDRGDGVLVLVPPGVPKDWLVTSLPERLETALLRHNASVAQQDSGRAAATQVRLRVAVSAGEVTFDRYGVVGAAIDHTFRLAEAPPMKTAFASSPDVCALIVSDWFYEDVVYHQPDARPDSFQHIDCRVKQTPVSAWMRVPVKTLTRKEQTLTEQTLKLKDTA
jgi:hypothetical protein